MMIQVADLLLLVDAYVEALGVEEKTLSFRVFGDSKKLKSLRGGADITVSRFNGALRWFAANWPDDVTWPEGLSSRAEIASALVGGEAA